MLIPVYFRSEVAYYATIDDADAELVAGSKWTLWGTDRGRRYATRYNRARFAAEGKKRQNEFLHEALMGARPFLGAEIDHINRDPLDNRRSNLRWVTHAENVQNKSASRGSTSEHRGVYFDKRSGRWVGQVKRDGRKVWARSFQTERQAADATAAARRQALPYATA